MTLDRGPEGPPLTVYRFSFESRKDEKVTDGITAFVASANGEKALVRKGSDFEIVSLGGLGARAARPPSRQARPSRR